MFIYKKLKFDDKGLIKSSLSILLNYIYNTQKQITSNINNINIYNSSEYMVLDMFTRTNLELTQTIRGNKKKVHYYMYLIKLLQQWEVDF